MLKYSRMLALSLGALALVAPRQVLACACGCGVFDVGTSSMFPADQGGMAYLGYDYMNQDQDWRGDGKAPAAANADKQVVTSFITPGVQYMFNRDWGINVEVPVWDRSYRSDLNWPAPPPDVIHLNELGLGDVRIKGIYTGLSSDMSTGLTFGVKLPTGNTTYFNDADSEIGSGSTDLLPGFFQRGHFNSSLDWFVNGQGQIPVISKAAYRPGAELDVSAGVNTNGWDFGKHGLVTPEFQMIASWRASDSGALADNPDSGYRRLVAAPGIEYDVGKIMVNVNVEIPVVVNTTGYQLVASPLIKLVVGYMF